LSPRVWLWTLVLAALGCRATAPETRPEDIDSDDDGVADVTDLCPQEREDPDGFEDGDGCPDADNDRDRVPDAKDNCPNDPETYNALDDDDGCPDVDVTGIR
jgi:hypothetical protein